MKYETKMPSIVALLAIRNTILNIICIKIFGLITIGTEFSTERKCFAKT